MNKSGYVKFDRKILEWGWYTDPNTFRLFFHLVMCANFADSEFLGVKIKRGQIACSYSELAGTLKLSEKNIRTALDHLKETGQVAVERHPKFSLITVLNYNRYQSGGTQSGRQTADKWHSSGTQVALKWQQDKKINNINNINNINKGVDTYSTVVDLYHRLCPSLPAVKNLTPTRIKELDKLLEVYDIDAVEELFIKAESSDFLKGLKKTNGKDWKATFGWLIDVENATKVLEGNFDDKASKTEGGKYDFESFNKKAFEKVKNS